MRGTQLRVDDEDLDAILRDAFGEHWHGIATRVLPEGVINDARKLLLPDGSCRILRIAPSDTTAAAGPSWFTAYGLRREAAVISAVQELSTFLPVTVAFDFDRRVTDRDWVIQEEMPGMPLSDVDRQLGPDARAEVWESVGAFTRDFHEVAGTQFGPPAWGPTFDRWSQLLTSDIEGLIADAERFAYIPAPFRRLLEIVESNRGLLDEIASPRLIHSDLCRPHIFVEHVDDRWRLTGTIDLEFGRFADPFSEHLITGFEWDNTPTEMRRSFMRTYKPEGEAAADRHRLRIYVALALAWFAPLLAMQGEPVDPILRDLDHALNRIDEGDLDGQGRRERM